MDNLNDKLSDEAQSQPSCLGAVIGSSWINSDDELPDNGENVEISDDGIEVRETANYKTNRQCMLAGVGGANGYFGSLGFATDGSICDNNLILDTPPFWRRY
jgi:hypothetical protein